MNHLNEVTMWRKLARDHNVEYIGIQSTRSGWFPMFTDPVTRTSFTLSDGETLAEAIERKRKQFGVRP